MRTDTPHAALPIETSPMLVASCPQLVEERPKSSFATLGVLVGICTLGLVALTTGARAEVADDVANRVCKARSPCRVVKSHPAGPGRTVLEVALHQHTDNWKAPDLEHCAPYEYWLVRNQGIDDDERQLLAEL